MKTLEFRNDDHQLNWSKGLVKFFCYTFGCELCFSESHGFPKPPLFSDVIYVSLMIFVIKLQLPSKFRLFV